MRNKFELFVKLYLPHNKMIRRRFGSKNIDDLLVNKRHQKCVPKNLNRFKAPLVSGDFPSRVSLIEEQSSIKEEESFNISVKSEVKIFFILIPIKL